MRPDGPYHPKTPESKESPKLSQQIVGVCCGATDARGSAHDHEGLIHDDWSFDQKEIPIVLTGQANWRQQ